ncbi:MAG: DUF2723 domain-containing protein, partial [Methanococcaceae archaeon]
MNLKILKKIIGAAVFCLTALIYFLTVQPSVSFWDPGEISAASYSLMVPHPPGGPFWLLLGRIFSMLPIASNIGLRINSLSVLASCFAVLILYLVIIKLVENYRGRSYKSPSEALITYFSAAIGALAFAYCDTFWFNAVESNYFAVSTLLYSLVVWLMLIWNEKSASSDNERYIIFMAYVIGLSAGVHLMSMLAILTFISIVVMRKYVTDDEFYRQSAYAFLIHMGLLLLVAIGLWSSQTATQAPSIEEYKDFDSKFKWVMIGISALYMGIFRKKIFNRNSFYFPLAVGGVVLALAYPGLVKYFPALLLYIGGAGPAINLVIYFIILAALVALAFWAKQNNKAILNLAALCFVFAMLGFSTYTTIIIRSNQQTPMNENEPKNFKELDYYLGREQYGDFSTFKRRFSQEGHQQDIYTNYSSDLDFLWRYQINHMYNRYLGWNFIGRESSLQDAGIKFSDYFAIPFIFGLLGLYFHFRKDWKMASSILILFIFMGYLIAFYQNQQQPQPRERDYFYAGALFVFCAWIALGVRESIELLREKLAGKSIANSAAFACLGLGLLIIPGRMLQVNYFTHDRHKDWVPWDMSYNLLQSCEKDAVLFTNGDNDTFPLWYLQYVEGVRRDIRIVCLSLANTNWYIKQLKNTEPYGAKKVKFSLSDAQIEQLESAMRFDAQNISLPVSPEVRQQFGVTDTAIIKTGALTFKMNPTLHFGDVSAIRLQDLVVKDIIQSNNWERPIYFASTGGNDSRIGLDDYCRIEGLASRLVPQKKTVAGGVDYINEPVMRKQLFELNPGYSTDYKPGFKFRGLNDGSIFYDETHTRLIQNYRNAFLQLSVYYLYGQNNNTMCIKTLDKMEELIPHKLIDIDYRILYDLGNIYKAAGDSVKFRSIAREVI